MEMPVTTNTRALVKAIAAVGARPLFVGGCVRDLFMGVESKDVDIEVHGRITAETIVSLARSFGRVDEVGKSFGVIKVTTRDGADLDISLPRRDSKVGAGHRGFTVEVDSTMTITEAAARRDFTMNAVMIDAITGEVLDPFKGVTDIDNGVLRALPGFTDDPLRVLRGVQFVARFGFSMDPATIALCKTMVDSFTELPIERVWVEWEKLFSKGWAFEDALTTLAKTGWVKHFPALLSMPIVVDIDTSFADAALRPVLAAARIARLTDASAFMRSIGAPQDFARKVEVLCCEARLAEFISPTKADVRTMARRMAPLSIEMLKGVTRMAGDWIEMARTLGVETAPIAPMVTGKTLIELGLTPGPEFSTILATAVKAQDRGLFSTTAEGIAWLVREGVL